MYISTAESDKELTAVAFVSFHCMGAVDKVFLSVIMLISYNMCACLCVHAAYPYFTFRCVFALGSESVRMCFQVQWVSLGRQMISPALLLHKLPAHYSNAAHLAQEEEGGKDGDIRKDCRKTCFGVTGFIQGEA